MNWNSWSEFFAMGGYATYVWGAFAVTFGAMAFETLAVAQRYRAACRTLRLMGKRRPS